MGGVAAVSGTASGCATCSFGRARPTPCRSGDRPGPALRLRGHRPRAGPPPVPGRARPSTTPCSSGGSTARSAARPRLPAAAGAPGLGRHRQHQVAGLARGLRAELASPWNTKWYRMTGGDLPGRLPAADGQPGPVGVGAAVGAARSPAARSCSPAARGAGGPDHAVDVSVDGGTTWSPPAPPARAPRAGPAGPSPGARPRRPRLMARATDAAGRPSR